MIYGEVLLSEELASLIAPHAFVEETVPTRKALPKPTPLLALCKESRRLYLRLMRDRGVLSVRCRLSERDAVVYVLVPHQPETTMWIEDEERRRRVPAPVQLPFAWRLELHTEGQPPMVLSHVHPCHLLWRRTLQDLPGSRMKRCAEEARVALHYIHGDTSDDACVHDLDELLDMWEMAPSTRDFYVRAVKPLAHVMGRLVEAHQQYVRWSRVRGARRLGAVVDARAV